MICGRVTWKNKKNDENWISKKRWNPRKLNDGSYLGLLKWKYKKVEFEKKKGMKWNVGNIILMRHMDILHMFKIGKDSRWNTSHDRWKFQESLDLILE